MKRPYWITVAKPACVIRVVTGLVDPSVAAASAPDDVVTRLSMMACGKMRCTCTASVEPGCDGSQ
jgi:hypothetical protein